MHEKGPLCSYSSLTARLPGANWVTVAGLPTASIPSQRACLFPAFAIPQLANTARLAESNSFFCLILQPQHQRAVLRRACV
jgi:hypothetical protein